MIKVINYLRSKNISCVFDGCKTRYLNQGGSYIYNVYKLSNGYEIQQNDWSYTLRRKGKSIVFCQYEDDFVESLKKQFN